MEQVAPPLQKGLGHGSRDMLEEVYGRLREVRHRSEVVEYRQMAETRNPATR